MKGYWKIFRYVALLFVILVLAGCDQDPLGMSERHISGGYYLYRWEDGDTFYVTDKSELSSGALLGSKVGGTATELGWNDTHVIVHRHSTFGGDKDGWMVIDLKTGLVTGPFVRGELMKVDALSGIEPMTAIDAWRSLGWW